MARGLEMKRRLQEIKLQAMAIYITRDLLQYIENLNRRQLRYGLNRDGELLPRYVDDPYFDTIAQALGYQKWKKSVSAPGKPVEVMDIFINGYTHSRIDVKLNGANLEYKFNVPWGAEIERKTRNKALGLNPDSRREIWKAEVKPRLINMLSEQTGIK